MCFVILDEKNVWETLTSGLQHKLIGGYVCKNVWIPNVSLPASQIIILNVTIIASLFHYPYLTITIELLFKSYLGTIPMYLNYGYWVIERWPQNS
jgi:hypothetical protein